MKDKSSGKIVKKIEIKPRGSQKSGQIPRKVEIRPSER